MCSGDLWGVNSWSGPFANVLAIGAAGFAHGQVTDAQQAIYESPAPSSEMSELTIDAREVLFDISLSGGLASASCDPAELTFSLFAGRPSSLSRALASCLDSASVQALLPEAGSGDLAVFLRAVDDLKNAGDVLKDAEREVHLGSTISSQLRHLTAPSGTSLTAIAKAACVGYNTALFGADLALPSCQEEAFAPARLQVRGGEAVEISLQPEAEIRFGGAGLGLHLLLGIPVILVHECRPARACGSADTVLAAPRILRHSLTATPSALPAQGGQLRLAASLANASTCHLSSTPAIAGLPSEAPCSSGQVTFPVSVPANETAVPITYTFKLEADGTNGASPASAEVTVTVAPASSFGACTLAAAGAPAPAPGQPQLESVQPNESGYACIVALDDNGGAKASSTGGYGVTIGFTPPMTLGGRTYEDGVAVITQTTSADVPEPGNTNTLIYHVPVSGTFTATVGVDGAATNEGGEGGAPQSFETSSHLDVAIRVAGRTLASESFTALGQSAPVSVTVSSGTDLEIACSNVQGQELGTPSKPGQIDVVDPTLTP